MLWYFTRNDNCKRHEKKCKGKSKKVKELESKLEQQEQQLKQQQELLDQLQLQLEQKNQTINITQNNNIIIINKFNERDISKITNKKMEECVIGDTDDYNGELYCVPNLIKYLHFNKDIPENHNMYITDLNRNIAKIYNGVEWETQTSEETTISIEKVIKKIEDVIYEWCDKLELIDKKYHKMMEFKLSGYFDSRNDEVDVKKVMDKIRRIMYDGRHVVLDTIMNNTKK